MSDNFIERTLALAAVFQAAHMVKEVAWKGRCNDEQLSIAVASILKKNSTRVEDIFSEDINSLSKGLDMLENFFKRSSKSKDNEITRYVLSMMHIEKMLVKNDDMIGTIKSRIDRLQEQVNIFGPTHDNVIANIAGLYTDTISSFSFRIHVTGEPSILNNTHNANKVRALLFFGIRCVVLWRQLGGSKWHLVFSKNKTLSAAKQIKEMLKEQSLEAV